jgi:AcrR family transcriptional regulator
MAAHAKLRDHLSAAIVDAAAETLSARGEAASMGDVADAAGVSRATLYRYFPSRDHLMEALTQAALDDAEQRLGQAELPLVAVPDALARMTRALIACSTKYSVLIDDRSHIDAAEVERRLAAPSRAVFKRGVKDGSLRADLNPDLLFDFYRGLLQTAVRMTASAALGIEQASSTVVNLFLDGARAGPY